MIAGVGIDIIDINRIRRVLEQNPAFRQKVFSEQEIAYCESKADPSLSYSARFAAKEAFMKALGTGWNHEVSWVEIETVVNDNSAPGLNITGRTQQTLASRNITSCHLSISHEKEYSVACVILERN